MPCTMLASKAMPAKALASCTTATDVDNDTPHAFLTRSWHRPLNNCRYALSTCQLSAPRFLRCLTMSRLHTFRATPELSKQKPAAPLGAILLAQPVGFPAKTGAGHLTVQPEGALPFKRRTSMVKLALPYTPAALPWRQLAHEKEMTCLGYAERRRCRRRVQRKGLPCGLPAAF
ncbi:unnamed protein product [Effrenium voratum]|nr:unnamed protein product [Effrenium voratum]